MNEIGLPSFLEEVMKDVVNEVTKKVRDSILLGKAKMAKVFWFCYLEPIVI